ncbi:MAG: HAD family hydrolase [Deltaproteobacteria bacterium]|nr:HAD family hydrolase [Deltaproteobacteria bacterium]
MKPAAFFDLDDTILVGTNSLLLYVRYLMRQGMMTRWDVGRGIFYSLLHKINIINIEKLLDSFVTIYRGWDEQRLLNLTQDWFEKDVKYLLAAQAFEKIVWHKAQGHPTILLSNSSQYVCQPVAEYLKMDQVLCSKVEVKAGRVTGYLKKPLCYKEGKVLYAQQLAEQLHFNLKESYFYTDSISDLPMLEAVKNPIAVNPDPLLKRLAKKKKWPILYWDKTL